MSIVFSIFTSIVMWLVIVIVSLAVLVILFLKFAPTFGGKPDTVSMDRIRNSPNFDGTCFQNLVRTQASTIGMDMVANEISNSNANSSTNANTTNSNTNSSSSNTDDNFSEGCAEGGFFKNLLFPHKLKNPQSPIITEPLAFDSQALEDGEFVWLGHSTVLFKTHGKTLITDPVFHRASPLPIGIPQFSMSDRPKAGNLPYIDIVLISHDHYDHLDHRAIKQMKDKVGHFYVPLGVKAHLVRWGVSDDKISEYDWYEEVTVDGIRLVFTPARHFSGRGLKNHRMSLWGSWVVQSPELSVYFSGDGGYSPEFANIGEKFGGFDIAFIEDGAYNVRWQDVHMLPEQSAQAGIDVRAKVVLPIHWGKFDLSTHQWTDPIQRIKSAMDKHNEELDNKLGSDTLSTEKMDNEQTGEEQKITITTPKIGQVFDLQNVPKQEWWNE